MPSRGRPPKPSVIKLLEGNKSKRPINQLEPIPRGSIEKPECPEWVGPTGKKIYAKLGEDLHEIGLLTEVDQMQFSKYCEMMGVYIQLANEVRQEGETLVVRMHSGEEKTIINPKRKLMLSLAAETRAIENDFGMDPASRTRIRMDNPARTQTDDLLEFLDSSPIRGVSAG